MGPSRWKLCLALCALARIAGAAPEDTLTVRGEQYSVAHVADRLILTAPGAFMAPRGRESYLPERLTAAASFMPDLAAVLGLGAPRNGFALDSVSLMHRASDRLFYQQVHDSICISGGFAQIAVARDGCVYEIDARVEPVPDSIQVRPLSRSEALALAIRASGREWDGRVFINRAIYGRLAGPEPTVYHQVVFGTLRPRRLDRAGRLRAWYARRHEDWEVFVTPDGRVLFSHSYETT